MDSSLVVGYLHLCGNYQEILNPFPPHNQFSHYSTLTPSRQIQKRERGSERELNGRRYIGLVPLTRKANGCPRAGILHY